MGHSFPDNLFAVFGMKRTMQFTLPIKTVSEANCRDHWAVKMKRVKAQRKATDLAFRSEQNKHGNGSTNSYPFHVKMTRVGKRRMDDDNLRSALKATRDQIAKCLGVNDGDTSKVIFDYAQETGDYAVKVEIK